MTNKQALYHQHGKEPLVLDILKDHGNGTVDLGHGEALLVASCKVGKEADAGSCTLVPDAAADKAAADKAAADKAAADKAAADKAAADKAAADKAAADKAAADKAAKK